MTLKLSETQDFVVFSGPLKTPKLLRKIPEIDYFDPENGQNAKMMPFFSEISVFQVYS